MFPTFRSQEPPIAYKLDRFQRVLSSYIRFNVIQHWYVSKHRNRRMCLPRITVFYLTSLKTRSWIRHCSKCVRETNKVSWCILGEPCWEDKHFYFFICIISQVIVKNVMVTSDDLKWPHILIACIYIQKIEYFDIEIMDKPCNLHDCYMTRERNN